MPKRRTLKEILYSLIICCKNKKIHSSCCEVDIEPIK